ncbi:acyltransferase family protein [Agreia sp. PsM10]|uniref:acyltransferase family protein n=1 Tax=Agreia sp. PsM10 TaxID=3030533 RepID=UPI00263ACF78|nr:acyltransferase family protein [Agreia sp. PsM10]MDN4638875.1 acyltransferase family protein [Agreia sp. PsM10]
MTSLPVPRHPGRDAPATGSKVRLPLWDNARYLAITLVVIGHAILRLISASDTSYSVYLVIYAFHVPVFVLVSGYFAKSSPPGVKQLKRLVTDLVLPYVIFETIWTLVRWAVVGTLNLDLAQPSWTLWFILSLIAWRVALPYLAQLRYPLLISVIISVWAGYIGAITSEFAVSRTLGLLPFFVLGWRLRGSDLTRRWLSWSPATVAVWRAGAVLVFAAVALVAFTGIDFWREIGVRRFLLFDESYPAMGYDEWWAGAVRLAVIVVAVILSFAFLVLVPRRRTIFTDLGQATLYIYLLHTFVLYPFRESGILEGDTPFWYLPAMILFAIVVTFLLASRPVQKIFRPLVEPKPRWLLRRVSPSVDAKEPGS